MNTLYIYYNISLNSSHNANSFKRQT